MTCILNFGIAHTSIIGLQENPMCFFVFQCNWGTPKNESGNYTHENWTNWYTINPGKFHKITISFLLKWPLFRGYVDFRRRRPTTIYTPQEFTFWTQKSWRFILNDFPDLNFGWCFYVPAANFQGCSQNSYNPLRGCFEQDRFTWKVLLQVFPGFERVLQAIQWHHNKPRKTCKTPAIPWPPTFTNAVCVLCLQPRISWSICPTVSPLTYLLYFAWHFLLKTSLYPCFPIFQTLSNKIPYNSSNFPPKAAQGCKRLQIGASEKNRKAAVSARVPPGKLQFLQECFLHLEQSRFEAAPWENVRKIATRYISKISHLLVFG